MKPHITYQSAETDTVLKDILKLQQQNLPLTLPESEKEKEGFVTVHHSFELLKRMNDRCPHSIAIHQTKVVGYALCMLKDFSSDIPVLTPMFHEIDTALTRLQESDLNYLVMGQICIAKEYRKLGIFRGLYEYMKTTLKDTFNAVITEVDIRNTRSSNAHKAIGFEVLKNYVANTQEWELMIWKWY